MPVVVGCSDDDSWCYTSGGWRACRCHAATPPSAAPDPGRSDCYVVRSTNPNHLVPSAPSPTNVSPLRIADRYVAGRKAMQETKSFCGKAES